MQKILYSAVIITALVGGISQVNASQEQTSQYYGGPQANLTQPVAPQVLNPGDISITRPESAYSCGGRGGGC